MVSMPPAQTGPSWHDAVSAFRQGRLDEAARLCAAIVAQAPGTFDATHLLGVIRARQGRLDEAERFFRAAASLDQRSAAAQDGLGQVLMATGRAADAVPHFQKASRLAPRDGNIHFGLGNALAASAQYAEAAAAYKNAIRLATDFVSAHYNLGTALLALGRNEEALAAFRHVVRLKPDFADGHNNLGNALAALGRTDEALAAFHRALALDPQHVRAHDNIGVALQDLDLPEEALLWHERALDLDPRHAAAHGNKGLAFHALQRNDEAIRSHRQARALAPNDAKTRLNEGIAHLAAGDYAAGWEGYGWRWKLPGVRAREFPQAPWRGESLMGKTILLHAEQGFGDTIMALRYVPLVAARGAKVVLEIQPELRSLASGIEGVGRLLSEGEVPPPCALQCPLMDLPRWFGTTLSTIPNGVPYLKAPADRAASWRDELSKLASPRVGIAWAGNAAHRMDRNRSMALDRLRPLLSVPGIRFVSLQREVRPGDAVLLAQYPEILNLGERLGDFGNTAAIISALDLVIGVDSAMVNLAGALGRPVWVLLSFAPDWRWLLERTDSPWYSSARLFRQSRIGDWDGVIENVCRALADFVSATAR